MIILFQLSQGAQLYNKVIPEGSVRSHKKKVNDPQNMQNDHHKTRLLALLFKFMQSLWSLLLVLFKFCTKITPNPLKSSEESKISSQIVFRILKFDQNFTESLKILSEKSVILFFFLNIHFLLSLLFHFLVHYNPLVSWGSWCWRVAIHRKTILVERSAIPFIPGSRLFTARFGFTTSTTSLLVKVIQPALMYARYVFFVLSVSRTIAGRSDDTMLLIEYISRGKSYTWGDLGMILAEFEVKINIIVYIIAI